MSACSGHGFKFASAIGELVSDLVLDGGSRFDLTPFSLARFGGVDGARDRHAAGASGGAGGPPRNHDTAP